MMAKYTVNRVKNNVLITDLRMENWREAAMGGLKKYLRMNLWMVKWLDG